MPEILTYLLVVGTAVDFKTITNTLVIYCHDEFRMVVLNDKCAFLVHRNLATREHVLHINNKILKTLVETTNIDAFIFVGRNELFLRRFTNSL